MADDIVGGLFGVNPDMYQQQQQQQVFNRAVALQNLSPFQQASVGLQQGGYNLAGALGGAMGGVDPQLQRISTLNAISKQIDQSNPESMLQGAKLLADAGFTQEALGLAQYARKANSEIALAQQRLKEGRAAGANKDIQLAEYTAVLRNAIKQLQARPPSPETDNQIAELQGRLDALPQPKEAASTNEIKNAIAVADASGYPKGTFGYNKIYGEELARLTNKPELLTTEFKNATAAADLSGFAKGTPEYNKVIKDEFAKLTAKSDGKEPSVGGDREAISKEKFFKPFKDLTQDEVKTVNAIADQRNLDAKKAAALSLKVEIPLGDAMTKALGMGEKKEQAAAWGTAGEAYKAAIPMIDKLDQVKNSLSSTFTGAGADAKLAFSKGLAAFGIPVNVNEIGKAEYFNAVSSQLVQAIARVFPGSQSNKELDQLLKSKPNAYQEIPTILRLIGQIQDEMIASTKAYEKLDALGVDGRSKANPAILEGQVYTKLKRYRGLEAQAASGKPMKQSDIDEAKKLQQELGVK
jgi:hypothetical protein